MMACFVKTSGAGEQTRPEIISDGQCRIGCHEIFVTALEGLDNAESKTLVKNVDRMG